MSRREQPTGEVEPVQLKDLSFNTHGYAMEDIMTDRNPNEIILALSDKSTTPIEIAIKKLQKDKTSTVFRSDLKYTAREVGAIEPGLARFLVVGYAMRAHNKEHETKTPGHRKQRGTGFERPEEIIPWDRKRPPMLVVAEISETQPESVQLWALMCPSEGLCRPFQIAQSRVFFRYEFRDSTTAIKDRSSNWSKLVSIACTRPGEESAPVTAKQERFKRARDTTQAILEQPQSLIAEIQCLLGAFKKTKNMWHLEEIQQVLLEIDGDIALRPPPTHQALRKFVDGKASFVEIDATHFLSEFQEQWQEVSHLTVERILALREGLELSGTVLRYSFLRAFMAEGCYRLHDAGEVDLPNMVCSINEMLKRTTPPKQGPSIRADEDAALFDAIFHKLTEIRQASGGLTRKLQKLCGDATTHGGTASDAWAMYAECPDIDSAKLAFYGVVRHVILELKNHITGTDVMIGELVTVLEKL